MPGRPCKRSALKTCSAASTLVRHEVSWELAKASSETGMGREFVWVAVFKRDLLMHHLTKRVLKASLSWISISINTINIITSMLM